MKTTKEDRYGDMIGAGAFVPESRVNGPGLRAVLWVRGCPFRCPGCFNPEFQDFDDSRLESVETVTRWILGATNTEGVSFSGGEPFSQAKALSKVAAAAKEAGKSVVVFTGHEKRALLESGDKDRRALLEQTDLLVAGPYDENKPSSHPLLGSSNQELVFLTGRYRNHDFGRGKKGEIRVKPDGSVELTGFLPFSKTGTLKSKKEET